MRAAASLLILLTVPVASSAQTVGSDPCSIYRGDSYTACVSVEQMMAAERNDNDRETRLAQERAQIAAEQKAAREHEQAQIDSMNAQYARDAAARAAYNDRLPATHAATIRRLKNHIAFVQSQVARERRVGALSGFVDARLLHQAGEIIEYDREQVARAYRRYRKVGGQKALSAL